MQQLNKVSTLEVVALCRFVSEAEKRHTMREFAISKLAVFFSRAISAAENKRLNVISLACLPVACCHACLALLTLCLSCSIAKRTACSSEQSIIGLRPRPERVCKPPIPSLRKRFTHVFTDTKLISVCSPAFTEDSPFHFRRTARQRIRKQWLSPLRKPFSNSAYCSAVNSNLFISPMIIIL